MPTCLYGLILSRNAGSVPSGVAGIAGARLRVASCGDLCALVGTVDVAPSRDDKAAIVAHDRALSTVVRNAVTVLSSRFGQTFTDDQAMCGEIGSAPHRDRVTTLLERYDGCGEMRIVMRDVADEAAPARAPATSPGSPGRAYLESIRETLTPLPPVDFRELLGGLVLDERVERRGDVRTISHLVRFADEARYRSMLGAHPALVSARILGPHALYSFAEPA